MTFLVKRSSPFLNIPALSAESRKNRRRYCRKALLCIILSQRTKENIASSIFFLSWTEFVIEWVELVQEGRNGKIWANQPRLETPINHSLFRVREIAKHGSRCYISLCPARKIIQSGRTMGRTGKTIDSRIICRFIRRFIYPWLGADAKWSNQQQQRRGSTAISPRVLLCPGQTGYPVSSISRFSTLSRP